MDRRVLLFPLDPTAVRRAGKRSAKTKEAGTAEELASVAPTDACGGPQLVYSRPASFRLPMGLRAQAEWIAQQIEREMARRVERETAERHRTNLSNFPYAGPMQATEITMRHRLLDAILCLGRPA